MQTKLVRLMLDQAKEILEDVERKQMWMRYYQERVTMLTERVARGEDEEYCQSWIETYEGMTHARNKQIIDRLKYVDTLITAINQEVFDY